MNGRELPAKIKPVLHLTDEDISGLGDISVGDAIRLEISGRVKSISEREIEKNKIVNEYVFEISSAAPVTGLKKTSAGQSLESRLVAE